MQFIDSHCHLDFPEFDNDRAELLQECLQKGIYKFVVPGVSANSWERLIRISNQFDEMTPAFGLHPYFIDSHQDDDIVQLKKVIEQENPIAIGEIGLDYYLPELDRTKQSHFFSEQILIAQENALPVILHVRKAHEDILRTLKQHPTNGGIVHAFNGSLQQADRYLEMDFKLGFGGALLNSNANRLKKLIEQLPLEAVVLETDSPDMLPSTFNGNRNTPVTLLAVAKEISKLKSITIDEVALQTTKNVESVLEFN